MMQCITLMVRLYGPLYGPILPNKKARYKVIKKAAHCVQ
jgi:hypothetical protein